jgi:peptide/nickel transport system substrate-binding protein
MGRRFSLFWLIVLLALILTAPAAQAGKANDTLNILHTVELSSVDNYFNTDRLGVVLCHLLWDSLLYRDFKTGEYKPNLAASWKFVDERTLEFDLRQGVKFHNGDEFDADDVVYTLNWVSDPKNGVKSQQNVNWIEKCEKLGKYKVRLRTKKVFPAAPEYIAGVMAIYPHKYYAKVGPEGMAIKPVGTGPYKGVEVVPGKNITLAKNENYFAASPKGKPSIGKLHIRFISEVNTQIAELMSGRADWIWRVPQDQAEKMAKMPKITVETADTMRVFFLHFDAANKKGRNSPLNKLKVPAGHLPRHRQDHHPEYPGQKEHPGSSIQPVIPASSAAPTTWLNTGMTRPRPRSSWRKRDTQRLDGILRVAAAEMEAIMGTSAP